MFLYKTLLIGGEEFQLARENIALDLDLPGRAMFQVALEDGQEIDPNVLVTFAMGWNYSDRQTLFFTGEIDRLMRLDEKQHKLFCRELSARLDGQRPLALRHPTLKDVLKAYSGQTGLKFILPDRPYASTKVPAFYGVGTGFHAFANIGAVFGIDDYIWQAQADGQVFVGSWQDSRWNGREIELEQDFYKSAGPTGFKTITALPGLHPGAVVNGERVISLDFSGHEMRFKCLSL